MTSFPPLLQTSTFTSITPPWISCSTPFTKQQEMVLKKQPSAWSKLPLIALRLFQLLGVIVVFCITGYFNYYLLQDGYKIPWAFIALDVVVRSPHTFIQILRGFALMTLEFRQHSHSSILPALSSSYASVD